VYNVPSIVIQVPKGVSAIRLAARLSASEATASRPYDNPQRARRMIRNQLARPSEAGVRDLGNARSSTKWCFPISQKRKMEWQRPPVDETPQFLQYR
jgi:hypothetical protein